jgi:plasmid maintenance system antidote protein VapI
MDKLFSYEPNFAVHPCEHIDEYLDFNDCSKEDFAKKIGWTLEFLENFLKGKISISDKIAEHLSRVTDMNKQFWLNAQEGYDSDIIGLNKAKYQEKTKIEYIYNELIPATAKT